MWIAALRLLNSRNTLPECWKWPLRYRSRLGHLGRCAVTSHREGRSLQGAGVLCHHQAADR
jgi:hypothetical protein